MLLPDIKNLLSVNNLKDRVVVFNSQMTKNLTKALTRKLLLLDGKSEEINDCECPIVKK